MKINLISIPEIRTTSIMGIWMDQTTIKSEITNETIVLIIKMRKTKTDNKITTIKIIETTNSHSIETTINAWMKTTADKWIKDLIKTTWTIETDLIKTATVETIGILEIMMMAVNSTIKEL